MSFGSSRFGTFVTSAPQERRKQRKKLIGKWQKNVKTWNEKRRIGLYEKDDQKEWKTVTAATLLLGKLGQGISPVVPEKYKPALVSD